MAPYLEGVLDPVIPRLGALLPRRPDALSLAQGMVSWGPPPAVREAVHQALDQPGALLDRYGATWGEPALLEAIARKLRSQNALQLHGTGLMVCTGSNMAFAAIAAVLCGGGGEVIFPVPFYFNHVMAVQLAGGVPVPVQAGPIPDPQVLRAAITPRTRAIVTTSPNNPSGVVIPPPVLRAINGLCAQEGLMHISDEAYEVFLHGEVPHLSPGSLPGAEDHTISLFSLSKAYGMAGWRMGYGAVPQCLLPPLAKVLDTLQISPCSLSQRAALAALTTDPSWCVAQVARLGPRRLQLLHAIARWRAEGMAVRLWAPPEGAFYGLLVLEGALDEHGQPLTSDALMEGLLLEHGVATVSGDAFGLLLPGSCVLRLSYGLLEEEELAQALERLGGGLRVLAARSQRSQA